MRVLANEYLADVSISHPTLRVIKPIITITKITVTHNKSLDASLEHVSPLQFLSHFQHIKAPLNKLEVYYSI